MNLQEMQEWAPTIPGWRWLPGMLDLWGHEDVEGVQTPIHARLIAPAFEHKWEVVYYTVAEQVFPTASISGPCAPVLTDDATIGCVGQLVRESWEGTPVYWSCALLIT